MYCEHCGSKLEKGAAFCTNCGAPVTASKINSESVNESYQETSSKSKVAAGVLGIMLGGLGVHNFYLGYTGKAVAQLLLSTIGAIIIFGPIISSIWGFIEGILYLVSNDKRDANGNLLV